MSRLSVIGTGYLGATHAACMAEQGHEVLGVDVDEAKVARLARGDLPLHEPGLSELLREHVRTGRLRFSTSYEEAAEFADVHFLCVDTPQLPDADGADLSRLTAAVRTLAPLLRRECLVVGKSTVPVGTAGRLAAELAAAAPAGHEVRLAWNPEFIKEGHAVADTLRPDRLVLGVDSEHAAKILFELYASMVDDGTPVVVTDFATAELVKSAANAFLATKLSFINAMAELCEAANADVTVLVRALSLDPRIGDRYLGAGLGFGGGCLPKDIRALGVRAEELGVGPALSFLGQVDEINLRSRRRAVDLVRAACEGSLADRKVAVLGGAFKPGTDDIRDSPALAVAVALERAGAAVSVYDPVAGGSIRRSHPSLRCADTALAACQDADVVVVATEWDEFRMADPETYGRVVARRQVVDARNALDADRWRQASWCYRALGRP